MGTGDGGVIEIEHDCNKASRSPARRALTSQVPRLSVGENGAWARKH